MANRRFITHNVIGVRDQAATRASRLAARPTRPEYYVGRRFLESRTLYSLRLGQRESKETQPGQLQRRVGVGKDGYRRDPQRKHLKIGDHYDLLRRPGDNQREGRSEERQQRRYPSDAEPVLQEDFIHDPNLGLPSREVVAVATIREMVRVPHAVVSLCQFARKRRRRLSPPSTFVEGLAGARRREGRVRKRERKSNILHFLQSSSVFCFWPPELRSRRGPTKPGRLSRSNGWAAQLALTKRPPANPSFP